MSDTWLEMVIRTMVELEGGGPYEEIYKKFSEIYPQKVAEVKDYTAHIRGTIESFSSHCERYRNNKSKNKKDLFEKVDRGHWKLRLGDKIDLTEDDDGYCEGKEVLYLHIRHERNNQVIKKQRKSILISMENISVFCVSLILKMYMMKIILRGIILFQCQH